MGKDIKETKKGKVMVNGKNEYIRFDWAAKYMLRSKADFAIFEGLIFVLLGERVTIEKVIDGDTDCNLLGFDGKGNKAFEDNYPK